MVKQMETKKIKCPKCGVVLEVKNSQNEAVKKFKCPRCGVGLQVIFAKPVEEEATTVYGGRKPMQHKQPRLIFGGQDYALTEGRNVVGRKAETSNATVQIATSDRYMSREHAVIVVTNFDEGNCKAVLMPYQNKNGISVNSQPLEAGDEVRLMNGCRITMGETIITYKE